MSDDGIKVTPGQMITIDRETILSWTPEERALQDQIFGKEVLDLLCDEPKQQHATWTASLVDADYIVREGGCLHKNMRPCVVDQALGVECADCLTLLGCCWASEHLPESLWNRACANDPDSKPCEQSRHNVCAICGAAVEPERAR